MSQQSNDLVRDVYELMRCCGVATMQELSDQIEEYVECDAWVPPLSEQVHMPGELEVRIDNQGLGMRFPFPINELWERLDEAEAEIEGRQTTFPLIQPPV